MTSAVVEPAAVPSATVTAVIPAAAQVTVGVIPGPAGEGVPAGGATGTVLAKASAADFDTAWAAGGSGGGPHAATHAAGSSDPVTLTQAQITGLTADLAALATDSDLATHSSDTTAIHGIADTSLLATTAAVTSAIGTHSSDTTAVHGIADTALLVVQADLAALATDSDLATHAADTTAVHGIADTAALATTASVTSAIGTHSSDTTAVHGIADTALLVVQADLAALATDSDLATHAADTTAIHGIADTSLLATTAAVTSAIGTHEADTTAVHGIADTSLLATTASVTSAIGTHEADTTAVHGIADTTALALKTQTINAQTGTTYTLVLTDAAKLVTLTNAAAVTLTVPTNTSVAFPVGTHVDWAQLGAGQVTVAPAGGVTVNATPTLKARAQYDAATLVKLATDTWLLVGDLATT